MKSEDISESLGRFEKQQEYKKQKKIEEMERRDERLAKMRKEKEKINEKKRRLNEDLQARKIILKNKVTNILESGNYKNKDDIYRKVFSEDELNEIKKNTTEDTEEEKKDEDFFLTQDKDNKKKDKKKKEKKNDFEEQNAGYTEEIEKA